MQTVLPRAGRWPLVLTIIALAACSDEPIAPKNPRGTRANAAIRGVVPLDLVVTNTSGGTDVGSLRWAAEQIDFVGGSITFDSTLGGKTIVLEDGLELHKPTEIYAPSKGVTISGKDQFRLIHSTRPLTLTNLTLTNGYAPYGSAIEAGGLTLDHTTVRDNRGPGSAIYSLATVVLQNSTVSRNATTGPAVEYSQYAQVYIDNSTIAFNAPGAGMGPYLYPSASQTVTLRNSIIANNGSPQMNCLSTFGFAYEGTNISNDWSCGEVGITVVDPQLAPLANNGGPNMTHAIPFTSPAFTTSRRSRSRSTLT